jgi:hypothetical protein
MTVKKGVAKAEVPPRRGTQDASLWRSQLPIRFVIGCFVVGLSVLGWKIASSSKEGPSKGAPAPESKLPEVSDTEKPFLNWSPTAGVIAHEHVGLVKHEKVGLALQVQTRDTPSNSTLLSIPYASCISPGTALQDEALKPYLESAFEAAKAELVRDKTKISNIPMFAVLSSLLREISLGPKSFFYPWLQIIPKQIPSDLYWGSNVASACLNADDRFHWEKSLEELGALSRALEQSAKAVPEFGKALGWDELTGATRLDRLKFSLHLIRSRGWERPTPIHFLVIPFLDLADIRAAVRRLSDISQESRDVNAGVRFDDQAGAVHLVSLGNRVSLRGTYITTSYANPRFLQESLRLYGFVDTLTPFVMTGFLFSQPAEGDGDPLPAKCGRSRELFFDRLTGDLSRSLKECGTLAFGSSFKERLIEHLSRLVEKDFSSERLTRCEAVTKKTQTADSFGAKEMFSQLTLMREALLRVLSSLRDSV